MQFREIYTIEIHMYWCFDDSEAFMIFFYLWKSQHNGAQWLEKNGNIHISMESVAFDFDFDGIFARWCILFEMVQSSELYALARH